MCKIGDKLRYKRGNQPATITKVESDLLVWVDYTVSTLAATRDLELIDKPTEDKQIVKVEENLSKSNSYDTIIKFFANNKELNKYYNEVSKGLLRDGCYSQAQHIIATVEYLLEIAEESTEDSTCVHMGKLIEDIPDSIHCTISGDAVKKDDCLGNCDMQTEDKPDVDIFKIGTEEYNKCIDGCFITKTGRNFFDEKFQPTKNFLLEHKDEYVIETKDEQFSILKDWTREQMDNCLSEDLEDKLYPNYNITKIYRLTKVWERDTRRELTIEEVEKEFNVRVKKESAE